MCLSVCLSMHVRTHSSFGEPVYLDVPIYLDLVFLGYPWDELVHLRTHPHTVLTIKPSS